VLVLGRTVEEEEAQNDKTTPAVFIYLYLFLFINQARIAL
jgi:hypothetical protein